MKHAPSSHTLVFQRSEDLPQQSVPELIHLLAEEYAQLAAVPSMAKELEASALMREAEAPTYVGRGLAVPHARVASHVPVGMYVCRSAEGLNWQGETATLVVFLAVPEDKPEHYLKMISTLMRWRLNVDESVLSGPAEVLQASLIAAMDCKI